MSNIEIAKRLGWQAVEIENGQGMKALPAQVAGFEPGHEITVIKGYYIVDPDKEPKSNICVSIETAWERAQLPNWIGDAEIAAGLFPIQDYDLQIYRRLDGEWFCSVIDRNTYAHAFNPILSPTIAEAICEAWEDWMMGE